jgi:hypothetical protein
MKWLWFELFFLFFLNEVSGSGSVSGSESDSGSGSGDSREEGATLLTKQDLKNLSIKKLKLMLEERDVKCLGCNEKGHYIDRVYETQELPVLEKKKTEIPTKNKSGKSNKDTENIEEVLEQLKKGGFGNAKVFTADDMKNFNAEDFAKRSQFNEPKKRRSGNKKSKAKEEEADEVEL